ncbi:hypothetical protein M5K25_011100 [Dendrobium thyrsiflorum]|uniref:Uncharacterized protein n=1 Tax=Dendrobium thyrsiflorum TaxID=117978 RepID=A0ABD0V962_DENTH
MNLPYVSHDYNVGRNNTVALQFNSERYDIGTYVAIRKQKELGSLPALGGSKRSQDSLPHLENLDSFFFLLKKVKNLESFFTLLKYSDLSSAHNILKTLHADLEIAHKELDTAACELYSSEQAQKVEVASLKCVNKLLKESIAALKKNKPPSEHENFHKSSSKHVPFRPRKRHHHSNRLINPFPHCNNEG